MSSYASKLRDPRWQRKRLEILQRDDFECQLCFARHKTLHVHHRRYFSGRDPWDYEGHYLVTLCEGCHSEWEEKLEMAREALARVFTTQFHNVVNAFLDHARVYRPDGLHECPLCGQGDCPRKHIGSVPSCPWFALAFVGADVVGRLTAFGQTHLARWLHHEEFWWPLDSAAGLSADERAVHRGQLAGRAIDAAKPMACFREWYREGV